MSTNHNRIKVADLETNQPNKILKTNQNGELEFSDAINPQTESYNALDCTSEGKTLDARQGKVLKEMIDNIPSPVIQHASAIQPGIINTLSLQELGGADKTINGVRIGKGAGNEITNTVLGYDSLLNNTTEGYCNTAIGHASLQSNIDGCENTAIGDRAGLNNTSGVANTFIGEVTGWNNTIGNDNTAVGAGALKENISGSNNTVIGSLAGDSLITGSNNTIIGRPSGISSNDSSLVILADGAGNYALKKEADNRLLAPTLTNELIDAGGDKSLITKEYLDANSEGGGITVKGEYSNNTAAIAAGLFVGDLYRLPIFNDISNVAVVIDTHIVTSYIKMKIKDLNDVTENKNIIINDVNSWNNYIFQNDDSTASKFTNVSIYGDTVTLECDIQVSGNILNLSGLNIYEIIFENTGNIDTLNLGFNLLQNSLSLDNFPKDLKTLSLSGNFIKQISSNQVFSSLKHLYLDSNWLSSFNITAPILLELFLGSNSFNEFTGLDAYKLLKTLDLSANNSFNMTSPYPPSLENLILNDGAPFASSYWGFPLPSSLKTLEFQGNDIGYYGWDTISTYLNDIGYYGTININRTTPPIYETSAEMSFYGKGWIIKSFG